MIFWVFLWAYIGIAVVFYSAVVIQAPWLWLKALFTVWLWPLILVNAIWWETH